MPSAKDWKVDDFVVIANYNLRFRSGTFRAARVTKVGRVLVYAGGQAFRADTYPCRSDDELGHWTLYRPEDLAFRRQKERFAEVVRNLLDRINYSTTKEDFSKVLESVESELKRARTALPAGRALDPGGD